MWWRLLLSSVLFCGGLLAKANSLILKQAQDDSVRPVIPDRSTARAGERNDPGSSLGQPLKVASLHQSLINNRCLVLNHNVDITLDNDTRLTGERVAFDTASSALLGKKVRLQTAYGVLFADRAHRSSSGSWHLTNARYSGCTAAEPHWALSTSSAKYKDKWLSCVSPTFRIAGKPIFWLPLLAVSLHERWRGTTLLPQLSYSGRDGFSVRQKLAYAWSPKVRARACLDWRSQRGLGGDIAFESPVFEARYWRQGDKNMWTRGAAQLGIGAHFVAAGIWDLGTDVRIKKDLFADSFSYDSYTQNKVGIAWLSDSFRLAAHSGLEVGQASRVSIVGPTRGLGTIHHERKDRYLRLSLLQIESEKMLPMSWPIDGAWRMGGGLYFADVSDKKLDSDATQGFLFRYWQSVNVGQAWSSDRMTLCWRLEPWSQFRHDVGRRAGAIYGLNGRLNVRSTPLRWRTARITPALTYSFWAGSDTVTFFDHDDQTARAQVLTPRLSINVGSARFSLEQPLVLQGREQLPYALAYAGSSSLLPLQLSADLRSGNYGVETKQLFDWQRMRFGAHTLTGRITHDRVQSHLKLGYYAPWYAAAKQLRNEGGLFVSCGIKCYSSRHLCWWLRSKVRYDSLQASWRALHHDVGIQYSGHCWALRAGYRQRARDVYNNTYDTYSWYLRFRFTPLGSLGISVKK